MIRHAVATGKPIRITSNLVKSCFDIHGVCGTDARIDTDDISMKIRRAGTCKALIDYPVFEVGDNQLCFYWDSLMQELPEGRYIGDLFFGKNKVSEVQFVKDFTINIGAITNTERLREIDCD